MEPAPTVSTTPAPAAAAPAEPVATPTTVISQTPSGGDAQSAGGDEQLVGVERIERPVVPERSAHGDHVTDRTVLAVRATLDTDAEQFAGTGVVGDSESGFLLNHRLPGLFNDLDQAPVLGL